MSASALRYRIDRLQPVRNAPAACVPDTTFLAALHRRYGEGDHSEQGPPSRSRSENEAGRLRAFRHAGQGVRDADHGAPTSQAGEEAT